MKQEKQQTKNEASQGHHGDRKHASAHKARDSAPLRRERHNRTIKARRAVRKRAHRPSLRQFPAQQHAPARRRQCRFVKYFTAYKVVTF
jgi:hypothetical protein